MSAPLYYKRHAVVEGSSAGGIFANRGILAADVGRLWLAARLHTSGACNEKRFMYSSQSCSIRTTLSCGFNWCLHMLAWEQHTVRRHVAACTHITNACGSKCPNVPEVLHHTRNQNLLN